VGNNIALVVFSLQMTVLLTSLFGEWADQHERTAFIAQTLISTIVIIFTAEFLPKAIARTNPNFYYRYFCVPIYFFYVLLYPIAKFSTWLSSILFRIFGLKVNKANNSNTFNKVDLAHLVEDASVEIESEPASDNDLKLFQKVLDFSELKVRHCMVPRIYMETIDVNQSIGKLQELFTETRYSRIPVYEGTIDNIIGYVTSKSLFREPKTIREVLIKVDYVTESMMVERLLSSFIKHHQSLAIVIDEFGGTAGMITIEDILEEIFGEIEDEHDESEMIEKRLDATHYVLSCRLEIDYLNEKYNFEIPTSDEYDTLAGFILFNNEGMPSHGQCLIIENMKFEVLKKSGSKLELVKLELL
ncbi:MAG: HlyC/CorC family transporter, partial [Rikenellaceae bacterium]|nr:HlyC/CorC family transporter [Rikenellaceae bacterium]